MATTTMTTKTTGTTNSNALSPFLSLSASDENPLLTLQTIYDHRLAGSLLFSCLALDRFPSARPESSLPSSVQPSPPTSFIRFLLSKLLLARSPCGRLLTRPYSSKPSFRPDDLTRYAVDSRRRSRIRPPSSSTASPRRRPSKHLSSIR